MKTTNLEKSMQAIHYKLNAYKPIKGSILCKANGSLVSSTIKQPESQNLAALFAGMFQTINQMQRVDEAQIRLNNGLNLYLKEIPSKKMILIALSNEYESRTVKALTSYYARKFQNVF